MNIFTNKIIKDFTFMESIWINYPETKEVREKIAKNIWEFLYYEERLYKQITSTSLEESIEILLPFKEFTQNNFALTSKIVGDFFLRLRENWNDMTPIKDIKDDVEKLTLKTIPIEKFGTDKLQTKLKQLKRKKDLYKHEESNLIKFQNKLNENELDLLKTLLQSYKNSVDNKESLSKLDLTLKEIEKYKTNWKKLQKTMENYFSDYYSQLKISRDLFHDPSLIPGLGWDLGKGKLSQRDLNRFLEISQSIKNKSQLTGLIDQLGRSSNHNHIARHHGINKDNPIYLENKNDSPKELLGINQGYDLSRILPSELVNLKNKNLKNIFYSKLLEKKLIQYQLSGENDKDEMAGKVNLKHEKGPIIACIDTSSSMEGIPEEISKGVIIKLYNTCKKEKRKLYLIIFSSTDELIEVEITKKTNFSVLIKFLQQGFSGGTDYTSPFKKAIHLIEKNNYSLADILMVTDGLSKIDNHFLEYLNAKRDALNFKIYTLAISHLLEKDSYSDKIVNYKIELTHRRWIEKFNTIHRREKTFNK